MRLRYKLLLLSGLLCAFLLWLHIKHPVTGNVIPGISPTVQTLAVLNHPPADYGHGVVYKKQGNTLVVTPRATGFPFDLGLATAIGGGLQTYLTTEIFFYRHCELLGGIGGQYHLTRPVAMLAIGYRMPWKRIDNVSVFAGVNTEKSGIIGVYWRFGSN